MNTPIEAAKRGFWAAQEKKDKLEAAKEGAAYSSTITDAAMKNFWAVRGKKEDLNKDIFWSLR